MATVREDAEWIAVGVKTKLQTKNNKNDVIRRLEMEIKEKENEMSKIQE